MSKKHYHHHLPEATGEPTIIEIKGEPYPEERDPELHKANELAHRVAGATGKFLEALDKPSGEWRDIADARDAMREIYVEYENMVPE